VAIEAPIRLLNQLPLEAIWIEVHTSCAV
jgi:hypothetical protein